jgi:hypothetical protein
LQAGRASDQANGTRPSPGDLKSKIDDLIQSEVSSGKLTSDQATELQGVFKAAFANGPGGAGGSGGPGGPGGAGGPPPGPPPSDSSSSTDGTSDRSPTSCSSSCRHCRTRSRPRLPTTRREQAARQAATARRSRRCSSTIRADTGDAHRLWFGAAIFRHAKDGCSISRADGSLFRAAAHIRNARRAREHGACQKVCSSSVSDQGETSC